VCCLAFTRASRRSGWARVPVWASTVDSEGEGFDLRCWFGDEDTVVAEVFAVRGRSAVACETTAPEVEGILPPISILRMRVFNSSSSSHTETAGPVEPCDSVPSAWDDGSRCAVSGCGASASSREEE
jgi:hypothetical protein